jgi:shikimate dehydrogenase
LSDIHLGLIGDNIAASRAPELHRAAARLCGIDVTYERLVPRDLRLTFDGVLARAKNAGLRGLNITHPYKDRVLGLIAAPDAATKSIGACNTVLLGEPMTGSNTDYTGYMAAFKERLGGALPGAVAIAGSGGAGKAIAFALVELGARSITLFDSDSCKSERLAKALQQTQYGVSVCAASSLSEACVGADGLINCTPLGMGGYGGNAFEAISLKGSRWICDVVYTPVETEFLKAGRACGVEILDGYELFIYQGVHAFRLFTGVEVDPVALRGVLAATVR